MDDYLVAYLREGSLRVQLHACKASAAGGVDYATVGEGEIPLAQLLEEGSGKVVVVYNQVAVWVQRHLLAL